MFFQKSPRQIFMIVLTAAMLLTSCTLGQAAEPTVDVNAINTAAVSTAMAQLSLQFTQTALAAPTKTTAPTNTAASLPTLASPTVGAGSPTVSGALPTLSFNTTPVVGTTPLAGFTPLATSAAPAGATASLGDSCNNSAFEGDITIPDGEVIAPGTNFQKIWKLRNTGTCTWDDGFTLVYVAGSTPNLDPYNYRFGLAEHGADDIVSAGEAINIALNLTSPCRPGNYEGHWRMQNDRGYFFGTLLSVYIEVKETRTGCG
jgi:hypothetical protein